jgi:hypothetical protein
MDTLSSIISLMRLSFRNGTWRDYESCFMVGSASIISQQESDPSASTSVDGSIRQATLAVMSKSCGVTVQVDAASDSPLLACSCNAAPWPINLLVEIVVHVMIGARHCSPSRWGTRGIKYLGQGMWDNVGMFPIELVQRLVVPTVEIWLFFRIWKCWIRLTRSGLVYF